MKASVRWLRELCPELPGDASALAARLTSAGLEVEAVLPFGLAAEACIASTVVSTRPHPTRGGLRLVTVDAGDARHEIVCGAPNVPEPGRLVVLARLGTHLPAKGLTIEARAIGGVPSEGMLCSEAELGLGDDASGILVLPEGTAALPGTPLSRALPAARDTILELGLTPNRADGLGHVGLAREAAALFRVPFSPPAAPGLERVAHDGEGLRRANVVIEDAERCPHYGAAILDGAKIVASPLEVRWRLTSLGVRSISNVVDVTNLVMLEFGHPMHAFDFDGVRGGRIVVRRAREGEKLVTLDGIERLLSSDDLVICDAEGPVALAGVMGGGGSEITGSTSRVLLECAYFDPRSVRRAARRHGLHTESSHRFERGVDWGDTRVALARATTLVRTLAGARIGAPPHIFEGCPLERRSVVLRHEGLRSLLGVEVPRADAQQILEHLAFARLASQGNADTWQVPSHRSDVTREVDLIEEVARVRGYDAIPAELPAIHPTRSHGPRETLARRVRETAVAVALSEAVVPAFAALADLDSVGAPSAAVILRNPLSEEQSVMRTSLLPGLLRAVSRARRHGERDARLFSVGALFLTSTQGAAPDERLAFAAVLAGAPPGWLGKSSTVDVWDAKGLAQSVIQRLLRREASVKRPSRDERPRHLHPRGAAFIDVEGKRVGSLGPIHPDVAAAFDVGDATVVVEIDLDALAAVGPRAVVFTPLPRFPPNLRDVAVVVREEVAAGDLEHAVREAAGNLAENVFLFDRFVGGSIPAGHASLAVRIVYRAADRTLTDAEVDARHARVVSEVQSRFGGQLRD